MSYKIFKDQEGDVCVSAGRAEKKRVVGGVLVLVGREKDEKDVCVTLYI